VPLDFTRAAQLFLGTEEELARALRLPLGDLRSFRANPQRAPADLLVRLGGVLTERGQGMLRVGQMLQEDHAGG
jgi:hypothetical protein